MNVSRYLEPNIQLFTEEFHCTGMYLHNMSFDFFIGIQRKNSFPCELAKENMGKINISLLICTIQPVWKNEAIACRKLYTNNLN